MSGAGISAESGIATFRDSDGLWEGHDVMEVASPQGWTKNQALVLDFYNKRRKNALEVAPNGGHRVLADLERDFEVTIITQNVDNLHERAGSTKVIHLHGSLFESRSTADDAVYPIKGWNLDEGDCCPRGAQLRPNIVWFGELVPMMEVALGETLEAEAFIVVGTSLVVYPAAGLVSYVPQQAPIYVVDTKIPALPARSRLHLIEEKASTGLKKVAEELRNNN